ncbi:Paired Mesoderm Homeobox Protein 1 [Manis pentadactyla]|nr:Paired Mesoderm Homeobox Protein 1 [Manis pentadactyla]
MKAAFIHALRTTPKLEPWLSCEGNVESLVQVKLPKVPHLMVRQICEQIVGAQSFQDLIQKGVCRADPETPMAQGRQLPGSGRLLASLDLETPDRSLALPILENAAQLYPPMGRETAKGQSQMKSKVGKARNTDFEELCSNAGKLSSMGFKTRVQTPDYLLVEHLENCLIQKQLSFYEIEVKVFSLE